MRAPSTMTTAAAAPRRPPLSLVLSRRPASARRCASAAASLTSCSGKSVMIPSVTSGAFLGSRRTRRERHRAARKTQRRRQSFDGSLSSSPSTLAPFQKLLRPLPPAPPIAHHFHRPGPSLLSSRGLLRRGSAGGHPRGSRRPARLRAQGPRGSRKGRRRDAADFPAGDPRARVRLFRAAEHARGADRAGRHLG